MVLLLGPCLYKLGFIAYFHINRTQIAAEHCVNLSRPELKCNGQCFFMKAMEEIRQREKANDVIPEFIFHLDIPPFLVNSSNIFALTDDDLLAGNNYMEIFLTLQSFYTSLLKPPQG